MQDYRRRMVMVLPAPPRPSPPTPRRTRTSSVEISSTVVMLRLWRLVRPVRAAARASVVCIPRRHFLVHVITRE